MVQDRNEASENLATQTEPVQSFSEIEAKLGEKFEGWERSRSFLYHVLGFIFEAADQIEQNPTLRKEAVAAVSQRADVRVSKRWDPNKKSAVELLLALRFGLAGTQAGVKSNWQKTLKAAAAASPPIPKTEAAFVEWITGLGGEQKARAQISQRYVYKPEEFAASLDERDTLAEFELDLPDGVEMTDGMALVLVRSVGEESGKRRMVRAVEVVTRKRTLAGVAAAEERKRKQQAAS